MESQLEIQINDVSYPVYIGADIFHHLSEIVMGENPTKICIVTDETIEKLHLREFLTHLPDGIPYCTFVAPSGEDAKTIDVYTKLVSYCVEQELDRKSLLIALGGGAVGDLTGFAAATFMRGINFIQVPTTILAHDSSVGGKTGLNLELGKNLIGSFHHPVAVLYYLPYIDTLPAKEKRSGFAEIIKESLINPNSFIKELTEQFQSPEDLESSQLLYPILKGIETKKWHVEQDERENGVRSYLNFGHTLGHAIEKELGYGEMTHGEAIMVGMVFALRLSEKMYHPKMTLSINEFIRWVEKLGYQTKLPTQLTIQGLVQAMKRDKKSVSGQIRFVLLKDEGVPVLQEIDEKLLVRSLEEM